jgi:glycosyltransferase involved in cell wall biosynthesis
MTYNHGLYIHDAMEGILKQQTDFKVEVVVGDDFSTDDTLVIIREYHDTENIHIRILERKIGDEYWQKRQVKGRLYNFTNIIENCKGKYIALLDGDDYWTDPLKLQKQIDFLERNPSFSVCFHRAIERHEILSKEKVIPEGPMNATLRLDDLLKGSNFIPTNSCVFRNFDTPLPPWFYQLPFGDYGLHLLNAKRGDIGFIDEVMGVYRISTSSTHGKLNSSNEGLAKAYQQHFQFWEIIKQTGEFNNLVQIAQQKAMRAFEFYKRKSETNCDVFITPSSLATGCSKWTWKLLKAVKKVVSVGKKSLSSLLRSNG